MMSPKVFLLPVLALVVWTLLVWLWMYATRIPAMMKADIDAQDAADNRTAVVVFGDNIGQRFPFPLAPGKIRVNGHHVMFLKKSINVLGISATV